MDYNLELPSHSKIHHVFHVPYLKKMVGSNWRVLTNLPETDEEGSIWLQPKASIDKQEHSLCQRTI
jgi:hypothetical protein